MKKIFVMAVFACFAAMNVNAQTEESESKIEKMHRLTKAADENPTDWKAQLEAGDFLLDKENGVYNHSQAGKYYERLFHLATDYNKEIPDSVIGKTGFVLAMLSMAPEKDDPGLALYYIDAMKYANSVGVALGEGYTFMCDIMGVFYSKMNGEGERSLYYMTKLRERLTKDKVAGIEYTDCMTAMLYDELMSKYKEMFGDKLLELTIEGKKYIALSMNEWNIEKPLAGWMKETEESQNSIYYCCDDGTVTDELHGQMDFSFDADNNGIKLRDTSNVRLITVTPERRQQLVEAYHNYMKKAKKDK